MKPAVTLCDCPAYGAPDFRGHDEECRYLKAVYAAEASRELEYEDRNQ